MADAGFFRGTSAEQDNRFRDKQKKLLKSIRFEDVLDKKVDMEKINLDVLKPWITKRITDMLGFEDDVVLEFVFNMLESEKHPDPKVMQINITGFLQAKNARIFMGELWELLVSAQENIGGIPTEFLEKKKEEIKQRKLEQERIQANLKRQGELMQAEADSTGVEDLTGSSSLPDEVRKATEAAVLLAESAHLKSQLLSSESEEASEENKRVVDKSGEKSEPNRSLEPGELSSSPVTSRRCKRQWRSRESSTSSEREESAHRPVKIKRKKNLEISYKTTRSQSPENLDISRDSPKTVAVGHTPVRPSSECSRIKWDLDDNTPLITRKKKIVIHRSLEIDKRIPRTKRHSAGSFDHRRLGTKMSDSTPDDSQSRNTPRTPLTPYYSTTHTTATTPVDRYTPRWQETHEQYSRLTSSPMNQVLLVGDSIIKGLTRYASVWQEYFRPLRALSFGIGGDRTQHVLWRLQNGELESTPRILVLHCGTNNVNTDHASDIVGGILAIVQFIQSKSPSTTIVVTGLLPRDLYPSFRRKKISEVNRQLEELIDFSDEFADVHFLRPDDDWVRGDGTLEESFYHTDHLHLVEAGDRKLAKAITALVTKLLDAPQGLLPRRLLSSKEPRDGRAREATHKDIKKERDSYRKSRDKGRKRSQSRSSSRSRSSSYSRSRSRSPDRRKRSYSPPPRRRSPFRERRRSPPRRTSRWSSQSPDRRSPARRSKSPKSLSPPPPRTKPRIKSSPARSRSRSQSASPRHSKSKSPALSKVQVKTEKKTPSPPPIKKTIGSASPPPSHHRSEYKKRDVQDSPVRQPSLSPSPSPERKKEDPKEKSPPLPKSKKMANRSYRKHNSSESESDSDSPPERKKGSVSPRDQRRRSPMRRRRSRDASPRRRRRSASGSDSSPHRRSESPRDRRRRSPGHRRRREASPPRRDRKRYDSPPRRRRRSPSPPPRRRRRDSYSPSRRRRDSPTPSPPPRRRRKSPSPSPPRRRRRSPSNSPPPMRSSPLPPPQRKRASTPPSPRRARRKVASPEEQDRQKSNGRNSRSVSPSAVKRTKGSKRSESRSVSRSPERDRKGRDSAKKERQSHSESPQRVTKSSKERVRDPSASSSSSVDEPTPVKGAKRVGRRSRSRSATPQRKQTRHRHSASPEPRKRPRHQSRERRPSSSPPRRSRPQRTSPSPRRTPEDRRRSRGSRRSPSPPKREPRRRSPSASPPRREARKRSLSRSPKREVRRRGSPSPSEGRKKPVDVEMGEEEAPPCKAARKSPSADEEPAEEAPSKALSGEEDEWVEKEGKEKKKKHKKHKKHGSAKHKKKDKKHKKQKEKQKTSDGSESDEAPVPREDDDNENLEKKLREKALLSMRKHKEPNTEEDEMDTVD